MTPMLYIRRHVLRMTQTELAAALGLTQASISRLETGEQQLLPKHQMAIRGLAKTRGRPWSDRWFFDVPKRPRASAPAPQQAAE